MNRVFLPAVLCAAALARPLSAQDSLRPPPESPVFRSYRAPGPGSLVVRSDVTYRMWQTFQLTLQANAGDASAQHELGIRYLTGTGVPADTVRGATWTRRAALQGVIPAQFNLGILLLNGWGVEWDPFGAFPLLERAARAGMPEAQYVLAGIHLDNLVVPRNTATAAAWASAAADSGYEPARLLRETLRGQAAVRPESVAALRSEPPDTASPTAPWSPVFLAFDAERAHTETDREFFDRLSRSGNPAVRRLAEGADSAGPADSLRLLHLEESADAGSPEALTALALLVRRSDPVRAAELLVRGVRHDAPYAGARLWELLERPDAAAALVRDIRARSPRAAATVAMLQAVGLHPPLLGEYAWLPDADALDLLRGAASAGYRPAALELGLWYYTGRWVGRDVQRALEVWGPAARAGNVEALVRETIAYLQEGTGDPGVLRERLDRGIRAGSVLAEVALAMMMERGIGGPADAGAAARVYREAAARGSQDALRALRRLHDERRPRDPRFALPPGS